MWATRACSLSAHRPASRRKWLAPRLHRFASTHPEIDARISSSRRNADFSTDGVDVAVRYMRIGSLADPALVAEKLFDMVFVPVCSPRLVERLGSLQTPEAVAHAPLIHDDTLAHLPDVPSWADWFKTAGIEGADVSHGLRFDSSDHALEAASEGAGVLLAHDLLSYDDLRAGRLVIPVALTLPAGRGWHLVYPKRRREHPPVQAFRDWIRQEFAALDWGPIAGMTGSRELTRPRSQ
jgi:LysR family glycine cleavage system transcriptional activator